MEETRQRGAAFRAAQSLLNGDTTDGCKFDILLLLPASSTRYVSTSTWYAIISALFAGLLTLSCSRRGQKGDIQRPASCAPPSGKVA